MNRTVAALLYICVLGIIYLFIVFTNEKPGTAKACHFRSNLKHQ